MKQTIITNSFQETQKIGAEFAKKLDSVSAPIESGSVLVLYGDLGSGKTTFIQGLAKGLGIQKKIISPTFIIMRSYQINLDSQLFMSQLDPSLCGTTPNFFYHVDLYRIKDEKEIKDLGLTEIMNDTQNIVAIEWPEKIKDLLPRKRLDIFFEYVDENKRKITYEQ